MRTIKFRAKPTYNNKWVIGNLVYKETPKRVLENKEPYRNYYIHSQDFTGNLYEVIPETIGQFTGLYDKNGKEIYEGDVVKDNYGEIGSVEWDNEKSWFYISTQNGGCFFDQGTRAYEIIGNIHDSPELLEQKKK